MPSPATTEPKSGTAVKTLWPFCRMDGVESFRPGTWNGRKFDSAFISAMRDNFVRYSTGPTPYYRPYLSINHEDFKKFADSQGVGGFDVKDVRFGTVDGAWVTPDGRLILNAGNVPEPVGVMRNSGLLAEPSIEFFEPVYDEAGKLVDGFRRPDGSIEPGPVLKSLTLLGADAPAVKGMSALPVAKFASGARVSRFGVTPMDRAATLEALKALGVDVSMVTDAVPDEFLTAILNMLQAKNAAPPVADATAGATGQMADATIPSLTPTPAPVPDAAGTSVALPGIPGGAQPSQVVLKFADATSAQRLGGYLAGVQAQMNGFAAQMAALNTQASGTLNAAKHAKVVRFVDQLATPDASGKARITPAQKDGLVRDLMRYDDLKVRRFADGKASGSELDERVREIEATFPAVKTFGEKMPDPSAGNGGPALTPQTREMILSGSAVGRQILARRATTSVGTGKN